MEENIPRDAAKVKPTNTTTEISNDTAVFTPDFKTNSENEKKLFQ